MKLFFLLILLIGLSSCSTMSEFRPINQEIIEGKLSKEINEVVKPSSVKTLEMSLLEIEEENGIEKIDGEITITLREKLALTDFLSLVAKIKQIPIIIDIKDSEKAKTEVIIPYYKGRLKDLFENIANTYGIFLKYQNNILVASNKSSFYVSVDRYPEIGKNIENILKSFKAEQVTYDPITSKVSFHSDYKTYRKIKNYITELNNNLSLLTLHVIVGEVEFSNNSKIGIDWENFSLSYTSPRSVPPPTQALKSGTLNVQQGVASLNLDLTYFNMSSVINMLEKYGKFRLIQNTYITVLNGTKGKIDASSKYPYVKEIGISTVGTTGNTATAQTVSFDEATSGVILEITPNYDSNKNLIHLLVSGKVENVVNFIEVSAGATGSKISRPIRTVKNIDTQAIFTPENVIILGGLISTNEGDSTAGLPSLSEIPIFKNRSNNFKATELVIIIKPELVRYVYAKNRRGND